MNRLLSGMLLVALFTAGMTFAQVLEPDDAPKPLFGLQHTTLPQLDSSTSAQPLTMMLACRAVAIRHTWTKEFDGSKRLWPEAAAERPPGDPANTPRKKAAIAVATQVKTSGTHGAYVRLIKGSPPRRPTGPLGGRPQPGPADQAAPQAKEEIDPQTRADLILVAREPSEDEIALAKRLDVELDVRPVARDAFVFIVNHDNPVKGLTLDQVRDIYTGKVTHWKDVGGPDQKMQAFQRNRNSGSQELMEKLVMKDRDMIERPPMMRNSMIGPINAIDAHKWGLGYTVYFYEQFMAPPRGRGYRPAKLPATPDHPEPERSRKLLAIDGVAPNAETIAAGKYPLTTEVYAVIRKNLPEDHAARQLRDWLLTEEGQALVATSGYVPIQPPTRQQRATVQPQQVE